MAYDTTDGSLMAASLSGGEPRPDTGSSRRPGRSDSSPGAPTAGFCSWSGCGRTPGSFLRRDISTGKTSRWLEFQPADMTGVVAVGPAIITPDGRSYAYSYERVEASDLFVVDGLR